MLEPRDVGRWEREIDALCREVGRNDPEAFAQGVQLLERLRDGLNSAAANLRTNHHYSWADLARPLGVTRSAAQQRFGKVPA